MKEYGIFNDVKFEISAIYLKSYQTGKEIGNHNQEWKKLIKCHPEVEDVRIG